MKKKILWLMLSWLIVAALVLASCGEAVPGEQEEEEEEEEEEVTPAVGEVQYGGTFTTATGGSEPPSPSMADANFGSLSWLDFIQERPVLGDVETYGPRGSGVFKFQSVGYQPDEYLKGHLLESWEVSIEKLVWHVRPGIYWAPTEHQSAWMDARELTAEDMALDIIRFIDSPWATRFEGLLNEECVNVLDRYTLEIEFLENYTPMLMYYLGFEDRSVYSPPEVEIAGADKWENQVGTGAFMFEEYVIGSYMSFVRNPNYWDTTIIDGVEYQMPFFDRVVRIIIPDDATRVSALRTGILDLLSAKIVTPEQFSMLDAVPDLIMEEGTGTTASRWITLRSDEPPLDDVELRRALMVGTNMEEFQRLALVEDEPTLWFPIFPEDPAYVPLEDLPADIQVLFEYNPTLAKQMLADAGYPEGLKIKLLTSTGAARSADVAALIQNQWGKIGVEVEIDAREGVAYSSARYPTPEPTYHGAITEGFDSMNPMTLLSMCYVTRAGLNYGVYSNPEFDALMVEAAAELDPAPRTSLIKEATLILLRDAQSIPMYYARGRAYWWPWVKNYYGEFYLQDDNCWTAIMNYMWLDLDLKEEMGY